jgi:dTDP-4-dehydrorhamnose reductase
MRCLILGGDGMLGHQLLKSWQSKHDVCVTLRQARSQYADIGLFNPENSYDCIDVRNTDRLREVLEEFQPAAVVNAVGIIKQRTAFRESLPSLEVNSVFPHRLRLLCREIEARMVHISTDCVFNGKRGNYSEQDPANADDLYGLSKYLGEVSEEPCLTLRTSIIGLELSRKQSLIEWFLAQTGTIKGFTNALYTGLTTIEMARVIEMVVIQYPDLHGVWQVASEPIRKYDLLCKLTAFLERNDLSVEPDDSFRCDRRLSGKAFTQQTGYHAPSWDEMLLELAERVKLQRILRNAA